MKAVFKTPVAAVGGKQVLGLGLLGASTADAVTGFTGVLAGLFIDGFRLDEKSLPNVGEVQITVEFGCRPDFPYFELSVLWGVASDKVRPLSVFKV